MASKGMSASHGFKNNPYLEVFLAPPSSARTSYSDDPSFALLPLARRSSADSAFPSSAARLEFSDDSALAFSRSQYNPRQSAPAPAPAPAPRSPKTLDVTFRLEPLGRNRIVGGYACTPCAWTFKRKIDLTQHWRTHPAHEHDYCPICKVLIQESKQVHWRLCHAICTLCGHKAINLADLLCHERLDHLFCCNRYFQSVSQMAAHLGSERHRIATVQCLFCGYLAGSVSIMLAHLEFGKCTSGFRKIDMGYFIAAYDQHAQVLSDDYRPTTRDQPFHPPCGCIVATEARSNGYAFACFFCEMSFSSLDQLNRHLGSPVHNGVVARSYRCPGRGCGERKYESMSALVLHIEAAGCDAYGMPAVIKALDNLMAGMQGIALSGR